MLEKIINHHYTKLVIQALFLLGLMILALDITAFASTLASTSSSSQSAASTLLAANSSLPTSEGMETIFGTAKIPTPPDKPGQEIFKELILGGLRYVKLITIAMGILFITIAGFKLVTKADNEEEITKAKTTMTFIIVAFAMISMAEDLARIFDMEKQSIISTPQEILKRVRLFDKQAEILISFVKYVIGAFATLMIVRSGAKLITAGGDEEETTKHKKAIGFSLAGLILLNLGQISIDKVLYKIDKQSYSGITGVHPGVDAKEGVEQLVGITNFVISFVGPAAVLMLLIGAIMYATAGGQEEQTEKAKRLLIATIIGIVIIYAAFALVSTIISGQFEEIGVIIS